MTNSDAMNDLFKVRLSFKIQENLLKAQINHKANFELPLSDYKNTTLEVH